MPSNITIEPITGGSQTPVVSVQVSHDGDTAQLQGAFLMGVSGTEDAYTAAKISGDSANGLDVDVTRLPTLPAGDNNIGNVDIASALPAGDNNIGNVDVVTLPALPAGSNNIGDVDVLTLPSLPAGTNNIGDVDVLSLPALPAGTNNIGDVDVLSVVPGTGGTSLGKAEDQAHVSGDVGVMMLAVRGDTPANLSGATGDYEPPQVSGGLLWTRPRGMQTPNGDSMVDDSIDALNVKIVAGAGAGGTSSTDDAAFTVGSTAYTPAGGTYRSVRDTVDDNDGGAFAMTQRRALLVALETPNGDSAMDDTNDAVKVTVASGAITGRAEDAAHASGDEGVEILAVRRDTPIVSSGTDGDYSTVNVSGEGGLWATLTGSAKGGLTPFKLLDVDETEDEVKATAGTLYGFHAMNLGASKRYLKVYNAPASSVTVGTTPPTMTFPLPVDTNGAGFVFSVPQGIKFDTGICFAATTGLADNDTGAPGTNEVVVNGWYL